MGRRRLLLLLLKPFDVFPVGPTKSNATCHTTTHSSKVLSYLDNRRMIHKETINFCQDIVKKKFVDWEPVFRSDLSQSIRNVDLVITIGGDGTLLQASHFFDGSIPVLGVNSDPTQVKEVEDFREEFDATRSTGFLCAATVKNFEQILDDILEDRTSPSELSRMSIHVNSKLLSTYALNDVLIAHPCPAAVSRFSLRIKSGESCSQLLNCRSSGLRVSTAAGSTAAILSAGGFAMHILSKNLQYMVREPILPVAGDSSLMHGIVKFGEHIKTQWFCKEGVIYIDGCHTIHYVQHEDTIELSSEAPILKVFLPEHLLL